MLEGFAVGDMARLLAAQKLSQVRRHDGALVREDFEGVAADVRRGDQHSQAGAADDPSPAARWETRPPPRLQGALP